MHLLANSFRGEAPRITPRALPDNGSQEAINARLQSGDLETWRRFAEEYATAFESGQVRTIHLMNGNWLTWEEELEVARGVIPGDATFRTYITGLDAPRVTNLALATTGSPPFPVQTRLLGVPAPQVAPEVEVLVTPPVEGNVPVTNPGAETGNTAGWTIESGALGVRDATDVPGLTPYQGNYFFYGGAAASTEATQSIDLEAAGVIPGQGLRVRWHQAGGADGGQAGMALRFYTSADVLLGEVSSDVEATTPVLTWEQREVETQVPDGAARVDIVQLYTRVGGTVIDAYIDVVELTSIDYTNAFDGSSLSGWVTSPNEGSGNSFRRVQVSSADGRPAPSIQFEMDSRVPYFYKDFAADKSPSVTVQFDIKVVTDATNVRGHVVLFGSAPGMGAGVSLGGDGVKVNNHGGWGSTGGGVETIYGSSVNFTWWTVTVTATQTSSGTARMVTRVVRSDSGSVLVDNHETTIAVNGPMIGFKGEGNFSNRFVYIDNISVTIAAPDPDADETTLYTNYVFTYVNEFGEEGPPSPASITVQRNVNATSVIETPAGVPTGWSDYGLTHKRLYRAATGASGTAFRFVTELDIDDPDFTDTLNDEDLGEVLDSEEFDLPPSDMRNILALPNGIMVGSSKNQLCFSEQNRPHAWPVAYRLTVDSDIVGLSNIDTTVVVGTKTFVYTASGNSPDSYSMSKPGVPQACTSRRSFATLSDYGAVFASPDGAMFASGPTQVRNLTDGVFTRRQWQALNPESILGIAHDDVYFFCWNNGVQKGAYAIDMKQNGFGVVQLGFHALAAFADPEGDDLYLVLDEYSEPTDELLPEPPEPLDNVNGRTIFEFDAEGEPEMTYRWRSKLYVLPHDQAFIRYQVRAESYGNIVFRFYADGQLLHEEAITSNDVRSLPMANTYNRCYWEVVGTSRINMVQVADDVEELV